MATISDDFTAADGDSLGANWTEVQGDIDTVSGNAVVQTAGFVDVIAVHSTALSSVNQYIKITLGSVAQPQYPICVLRYTDSSSPFYLFYLDGNNGNVDWYRFASVGGSSALITSGTLSAFTVGGDSLGLTIEGTGTSTVVRGWKNPSGDAPTNATTWGGASAGFTLTTDPASPVDTGGKVGFGGTQGSAGSVNISAFRAGDIAGPMAVQQVGSLALQGSLGISATLEFGLNAQIEQQAPIALQGSLAISGDIAFKVKRWSVPSNAPEGTPVHVMVFSGAGPTYAILAQGDATVEADESVQIPASGTIGAKAFAVVHNYDDDTETTSIFGGPCIATIVDVG